MHSKNDVMMNDEILRRLVATFHFTEEQKCDRAPTPHNPNLIKGHFLSAIICDVSKSFGSTQDLLVPLYGAI